MKPFVKVAFLLLFCITVNDAGAAAPENGKKSGVYLNEIGVGLGYAWGKVGNDPVNLEIYPAFVRLGFNMNSLVGMEGSQRTVQFVLEPFLNSISRPEAGVEAGCSIGFRYLHPLSASVDLFAEATIAPMYLSIKSDEQAEAGFNFLNQFGAGLQYKVSKKMAVFAGYRYRHLSHAKLADRPNSGINSNALVAGFSWLY